MDKHAYIIAEAGAGADAVKFQTFKADKLVSHAAPKAGYQINNTGTGESQYEMLRNLELDEAAHRRLMQHCRNKGIEFLSTPFDLESLDMLVSGFDLSRIKLASGEITNAPFLLAAACTGKPVILSTGMSDLGDVESALAVLAFGYTCGAATPSLAAFEAAYCSNQGKSALSGKVTLLHCTTEYPAPLAEVNLCAMTTLHQAFRLPVGYSDHTSGIAIAIAATALGATVIEKHFTLDRNLPGPDHRASLEPGELKQMVQAIRDVELALGSPVKQPASSELGNRSVARKSLVAAKAVSKGASFSVDNLNVKRPGTGISPMRYWEWLGKIAERDYQPDDQVGP